MSTEDHPLPSLWTVSADGLLRLDGEQIVDANPVARALLGAELPTIRATRSGQTVSLFVDDEWLIDGQMITFDGQPTALITPTVNQRWTMVNRGVGLGTLLGGVVHEINNPLTFILTNAQMARDVLQSPHLTAEDLQDLEESMEDIRVGAERLRSLSAWLRSLARSERSTPNSDNAQLDEAFGLALRLAGNSLRARAQVLPQIEPVPPLAVSPGALLQICLNLLLNTIAALSIDNAATNRVWVRVWSDADAVHAEVSDNGPGIAPGVHDRIFDPFYSTTEGPGLGLTMVRAFVVDRFGGSLSVTDRPGGGTQVHFHIPHRAQITPQATRNVDRPTRRRVLLIDDDAAVRRGLVRELRRHDLEEADSVRAAIKHLTADDRFDLILCDLLMPVEPGTALYTWLQAERPQLAGRLVIMTGGELVSGAETLLIRMPKAQRIAKPITARDVDRLIAQREAVPTTARSM